MRRNDLPVAERGNASTMLVFSRPFNATEPHAAMSVDRLKYALPVIDKFAARHDECNRTFAKIGVGRADLSGIGNLMRLQKRCLDFLLKDVHAAGNDHVIQPVGKEQIAFFIDIADTEFFDLKISSKRWALDAMYCMYQGASVATVPAASWLRRAQSVIAVF